MDRDDRSIRISNDTHRSLIRLQGKLQAEEGRKRTMADVIGYAVEKAQEE